MRKFARIFQQDEWKNQTFKNNHNWQWDQVFQYDPQTKCWSFQCKSLVSEFITGVNVEIKCQSHVDLSPIKKDQICLITEFFITILHFCKMIFDQKANTSVRTLNVLISFSPVRPFYISGTKNLLEDIQSDVTTALKELSGSNVSQYGRMSKHMYEVRRWVSWRYPHSPKFTHNILL